MQSFLESEGEQTRVAAHTPSKHGVQSVQSDDSQKVWQIGVPPQSNPLEKGTIAKSSHKQRKHVQPLFKGG